MEKDKKYRRKGWIASAIVQLFMLIIFYFLVAWKEPFPPIPTYGIELNFGFQNTGSGDEPVESVNETTEQQEVQDQVEEEASESTDEPVEEPEVLENVAPQPITEDVNSPDVVEQPKSEPVTTPKETKPVTEPKPTVTEKPKEPTPVKEEPKINEDALFPTGNANNQNTNTSQGITQGSGDEGKEEGTIDGRALYGTQGSSDGASLQMAGWTWDFKPNPNDKSDESGKIVYKIIIDDEGYLSRIDLVSSTVSPEVERLYRQSVERLSFSKTNDYKPAATSTGLVTFIIRTR